MGSFSWDSSVVVGTSFSRGLDGVLQNHSEFELSNGRGGGLGLCCSSSSLVLDNVKGELVRAPAAVAAKLGQKGASEAKAKAALKSHSEAERRRRERINTHLNTLRSLIPCTEKMDKASLLAEVVSHLKEMKRTTTEACKGLVIPMDVDELRVEPHEEGSEGLFSIKASLCCEDRPEILTDLKQAIKGLKLKTVKAEISTFEGRMKNVFVMTGYKEEKNIDTSEVHRVLVNSVHQALKSVLDKFASPQEFSLRMTLPNKRRRISLFDYSSSSSCDQSSWWK